ncbi:MULTISPECIES: hypothetical protein [Halocynthiibacter]|uniref:Uncharacterized protein n=1 Tax=Halocynthiibacter halioticoli TaxID=2986804 RepID=A0AAE3J3N1_9RHOB|nr:MULTISPECIES: hypothetical protein [Halocynthiibacter]MCV6826081.1 hypothetical protein [Halocynthiibacter halioticoli]MCW4059082.1 hypothetical protein [Halocynthiibacter sp. SDUM655004]
MAKRTPPTTYTTPGLDLDFAPYSSSILQEIIKQVGYPASNADRAYVYRIITRLNAAATLHRFELDRASEPTDHMNERVLKQVARVTQSLHSLLPIVSEEGAVTEDACNPCISDGIARLLEPSLRTSMQNRLVAINNEQAGTVSAEELFGARSSAEILLQLSEHCALLAEAATYQLKQNQADADPDNAGDESPDADTNQIANAKFTFELIKVYVDLFARSPGVSKSSIDGKPSGPLIRFLRACFNHIPNQSPSDATFVRWIREANTRFA